MDDLKNIGFYTLSDERAKNTSVTSQMKRCEMIITEYCNFHLEFVDVDSIKTFMRERGIQTLWAWKNSCEEREIKI